MGTNYYLMRGVCDTCGRPADELHIGKSSCGWCFTLHVIPEEGINSLEDWMELFRQPYNEIRDEYSRTFTAEDMMKAIINRENYAAKSKEVPSRYNSWDDFHRINGSKPGPHGLLRHKVDGEHCIANGEGTWDLIQGEFS